MGQSSEARECVPVFSSPPSALSPLLVCNRRGSITSAMQAHYLTTHHARRMDRESNERARACCGPDGLIAAPPCVRSGQLILLCRCFASAAQLTSHAPPSHAPHHHATPVCSILPARLYFKLVPPSRGVAAADCIFESASGCSAVATAAIRAPPCLPGGAVVG